MEIDQLESSLVFKECLSDLLKLLKRKFIQSLAFACYIVRPKEKEKFINELTLDKIFFILCFHGLHNEDISLITTVSEILKSDRELFKVLRLFSPEFEFEIRRDFKLLHYQIDIALDYSDKIKKSKLLLTPKSIYRILCGYTSRIPLRPCVREMEYSADRTKVLEETPDESKNELKIDTDVIAIASTEGIEEKDSKKPRRLRILFVKKEKGLEIEKYEGCKQWTALREIFQKFFSPKVCAALEFACQTSIYGKEFTLKSLDTHFRRHFILFLYGLTHRDLALLSLVCNWFAFSDPDNQPFPPTGFENWLKSSFIFPRNRLLSGARLLRRIKYTELLYVIPSVEKVFVNIPVINLTDRVKINLKDVVEGNVKRIRAKKKKIRLEHGNVDENNCPESEQISANNKCDPSQCSKDSAEPQGLPNEGIEIKAISYSRGHHAKRLKIQSPDQSNRQSILTNIDPEAETLWSSENPNILLQSLNNISNEDGETNIDLQPPNYPMVQSYTPLLQRSEGFMGETNCPPKVAATFFHGGAETHNTSQFWYTEPLTPGIYWQGSQTTTPNPSLSGSQNFTTPDEGVIGPSCAPIGIESNRGMPDLTTHYGIYQMEDNGHQMNRLKPLANITTPTEKSDHFSREASISPFQRSDLTSNTKIREKDGNRDIPEPPPPPVLSKVHSPPLFSSKERDEADDSSLDSILKFVEEKEKKINQALLKAAGLGKTEYLSKLASISGPELLRRATDKHTGETLLHLAAKADHESTVEYLLQFIGVDCKDLKGQTPLHSAVLHGRSTIVEILLESNATPSLRDHQGRTAYDVAIANGKKRIADKIMKLAK